MINIIMSFLRKWSCNHKWTLESKDRFSNSWGNVYHITLYKCSECGNFKKIKIK